MHINVERRPPVVPPIEKVVITLSAFEACALRGFFDTVLKQFTPTQFPTTREIHERLKGAGV
jgi:hypothetical protein